MCGGRQEVREVREHGSGARERRTEDVFVTFALTAAGDIEPAKVQAISPLADFSFDYQDWLLTPVTRY